jgi:hypothetical protein
MGGSGSGGRHNGYHPKILVEECQHLGTKELVSSGGIRPGEITNAECKGKNITFGVEVDATNPHAYTYRVHYTVRATYDNGRVEDEEIDETRDLAITYPNYGGRRYWFVCPGCGRRTTKLHISLPMGLKKFRCRKCHGLTYRSTLHSHDEERMYKSLIRLLALTDHEVGL